MEYYVSLDFCVVIKGNLFLVETVLDHQGYKNTRLILLDDYC